MSEDSPAMTLHAQLGSQDLEQTLVLGAPSSDMSARSCVSASFLTSFLSRLSPRRGRKYRQMHFSALGLRNGT